MSTPLESSHQKGLDSNDSETAPKKDFLTGSSDSLVSSLNQAQKEAVLHIDGPLLIIAGAGSGKTRVLSYRIANLILNGVRPDRILALTFTNKAAQEMRERISQLLTSKGTPWKATQGHPLESNHSMPWIGTFHSLGVYILRREAKNFGLTPYFTIFDDEDRLSLIKESIKELELDPKQFQPSRIKSLISQKKGDLITVEDHLSEANDPFNKTLARIWQSYEDKLKDSKSLDFDDLLVRPVTLFQKRPDVLKRWQDQWNFINIDEYQDTDRVQYTLANLLADIHRNIYVVGDIDQSIYSFRGADFRNILNFENDWPQTKIITLEENYRSTKPILDAANAVIIKNIFRRPKNLFTREEKGEKIKIFTAQNEDEEAEFIASTSKNLIEKGVNPHSIAVLFRTNAQSRILEEKFLAWEIPYSVIGVKFYARKEIKDILSYLRASLNPHDLVSIKRIINVPARGIGKVLVTKYFSRIPLSDTEKKKIQNFEALLTEIKAATTKLPTSKIIELLLKKSSYCDLFSRDIEEDVMRLGNIKEFLSLSRRFDFLDPPKGITSLLEEAALMSSDDSLSDKTKTVPLTTVHSAKGLEFDYVFVSGLEDGLFPHTTLAGEDGKLRLEEERRLFYVALTRARKKIFLTLAIMRTIFGEKQINMPSRFLDDIPSELIDDAREEEHTIELI